MKVKLTRLKCSKCGHEWVPESEEVHICPVCKTALTKHPPKIVKGAKK